MLSGLLRLRGRGLRGDLGGWRRGGGCGGTCPGQWLPRLAKAEILLHGCTKLTYPRWFGALSRSGHCHLPPYEVHRFEARPDFGHLLHAPVREIDGLIGDECDLLAVRLYLERGRDEAASVHVEQRPPTEGFLPLQDDFCLSPFDLKGGRNPRVV